MPKRILALDFDGVVCDSIDECMLTAVNAYRDERGEPLTDELAAIPDAFQRTFRAWRYFVRPARHYAYLVHATLNDLPFTTQAAFDAEAEAFVQATMPAYGATFDRVRAALRAERPDAWLGLHRLADEFAEGWPQAGEGAEVYVVTTKDEGSVQFLSEAWGLGIDPVRVWGRGRTDTKPEAIRAICAIEDADPEHVVFVDDHPVHLAEITAMGASCYWAAWGYPPDAPGYARLDTLADLPAA